MTTSYKTVLGIVAVAVIALGGMYAYSQHSEIKPTATNTETGLPTSATDTSDSALVQDANAIDAQLQATNADNTAVDNGIQTHSQVQ
jgi:hypothetical protein